MFPALTNALILKWIVLELGAIARVVASRVALEVASDFATGTNKDWRYYTGLAAGTGVALATLNPGSLIRFYAFGRFANIVLREHPEGAQLRVFVDGVERSVLDLANPAPQWTSFLIDLIPDTVANELRKVEILVEDNPGGGTLAAVEGIWSIDADGETLYDILNPFEHGEASMAYDVLSFSLRDSETDGKPQSFAVYLPAGQPVGAIQAFADVMAAALDDVTGSQITGVSLTLGLTLPVGLKGAPVAGTLNERGGLITFDTTGPRASSIRIPGILASKMPGDAIVMNDSDIEALVSLFTSDDEYGGETFQPVTEQDYQYVAPRRGVRSFRK